MKTLDFDYHLTEPPFAQIPVEPRDASYLLILYRDTGKLDHRIFPETGYYLGAGDLLVLNQRWVI